MISLENVTKDFAGVRALDAVDVTLTDGSIFGLIGSNGSGKSTMLRIMSGIIRPQAGTVRYDGEPVWENPTVKARLVMLSDEPYFLAGANLDEMAKLYASIYPTFSREKYEALRKLFDLPNNRKVTTFSKGMQKQASLLLGLAACPKYLFCDETFDGLDPVMRVTARKLFADEVADSGMTVVIASHNLRELEDLCDRVALLHKGKLLFEQELDEMKLGLCRMQAVLTEAQYATVKEKMRLLHTEKRGQMYTLVARGTQEAAEKVLCDLKPTFYEFIPLTLEEIFLAEMEDRGYDSTKFLA